MRKRALACLSTGIVAGLLGTAEAKIVNLADATIDGVAGGDTGTINGGTFTFNNVGVSGTGTYIAFVRVQANGMEEGYNTSERGVAYDENTSPSFTHDLTLGEVAVVDLAGVPNLEFSLDVNEVASNGNEYISLDRLEVWVGPNSFVGSGGAPLISEFAGLGLTQIYDMDGAPDGDSAVYLDYNKGSSGSGQPDMFFHLPVSSLPAGVTGDTFVYLYSKFGESGDKPVVGDLDGDTVAHLDTGDGFEEWAQRQGVSTFVVPVPAAAWMGLPVLAGIAIAKRRMVA